MLFIFNFRTRERELGERRDSYKPGISGHGGRAGFSLTAVPKAPGQGLHTWRGALGARMGFSLPSTAIFGFGPCPWLQTPPWEGSLPASKGGILCVQQRWQENSPRKPGNEVSVQDGQTRFCPPTGNSLTPSSKTTLKASGKIQRELPWVFVFIFVGLMLSCGYRSSGIDAEFAPNPQILNKQPFFKLAGPGEIPRENLSLLAEECLLALAGSDTKTPGFGVGGFPRPPRNGAGKNNGMKQNPSGSVWIMAQQGHAGNSDSRRRKISTPKTGQIVHPENKI